MAARSSPPIPTECRVSESPGSGTSRLPGRSVRQYRSPRPSRRRWPLTRRWIVVSRPSPSGRLHRPRANGTCLRPPLIARPGRIDRSNLGSIDLSIVGPKRTSLPSAAPGGRSGPVGLSHGFRSVRHRCHIWRSRRRHGAGEQPGAARGTWPDGPARDRMDRINLRRGAPEEIAEHEGRRSRRGRPSMRSRADRSRAFVMASTVVSRGPTGDSAPVKRSYPVCTYEIA